MTDGTPHGWGEWQAFLASEQYSRDVGALMAAVRSGRTLDIGLSIECLASCAFSAGLDVAPPEPAAHEVAQAGGQQLPGMEDVAPKPAEGRYPG